MPLLEAIIGKLRPKEFSGTVVSVRLLDGFVGPGNQYNRYSTGHMDIGVPIKTSSRTEGTYEIILQGPQGEVKKLRHFYSEPPGVGSQLTVRYNLLDTIHNRF